MDATKALVQANVTSRLDYCNSLLLGLPDVLTRRLQRVQNRAARIITYTRRDEHITPVLRDLHWLQVAQRVEYKTLVLVYKTLHGRAPGYLTGLLQAYAPTRELRSSNCNLLVEPRFSMARYGGRRFSVVAPRLWNGLPMSIRESPTLETFKSLLKTHFFKLSYLS